MSASSIHARKQIPLVVHLIYRLDFGGLETLLVDCINHMPAHKYRHAIVCLNGATAFADRITRGGVELFDLKKRPGASLDTHRSLYWLLRRLRPAVLHTYNLAALEYNVTATLAGVPVRIHAEHGRDLSDPQGLNRRHNLLRRLVAPFIDHFIPVSDDLHQWLLKVVGTSKAKTLMINNGVDTERYCPGPRDGALFVIGTVGRVQDVKHQASLIDAFIALRALRPDHSARLRLVIVGDGPLRDQLAARVARARLGSAVTLAGARSDIADLLRGFSVFALSSIAEGTPVTLLEAMASGLPVVSTAVGGVPELVQEGVTGYLVPSDDPAAMAAALARYADDPGLCASHGAAGRARIGNQYSVTTMVQAYADLYDRLRSGKLTRKDKAPTCAE